MAWSLSLLAVLFIAIPDLKLATLSHSIADAVVHGRFRIVVELIRLSEDVNPERFGELPPARELYWPNDDHVSPLCLATRGHSAELHDLLVAAGAGADCVEDTALQDAVARKNVDYVRKNASSATPLGRDGALRRAIDAAHLPLIKVLLANGASLDPFQGGAALTAAIEDSTVEHALVLLHAGANPSVPNRKRNYRTPITVAMETNHGNLFDQLLRAGADPTPSFFAQSPLMTAIQMNRLDYVRKLVAAHAKLELQGEYTGSPLMKAAELGRLQIVSFLLTAGANPNAKDRRGETALWRAAREGHATVVAALIRGGAEVNPANMCQTSAMELARLNGHDDVVRLIERALHDRNRPPSH